MNKIEVQWNENPDTFGFHHGKVQQGDHVMPFRFMPPTRIWRGQTMHPDCEPLDTHWQVIVDNLRVAVERPEDLGEILMSLLGDYKEAQAAGQRLASWKKKKALGRST